MRVLENLWYGNIHPIEQGYFKTEPGREYTRIFDKQQAKLLETLNDEEKAVYGQLHDTWMKLQGVAECEAFVTGFSLAVQIMAEATNEKEFSTD